MLNKNPGKHWAKRLDLVYRINPNQPKSSSTAPLYLFRNFRAESELRPAMFSSRVHSKASFSNQNEQEKSQQFRIPGGKNRILASLPPK
jgi:hypothetical protein